MSDAHQGRPAVAQPSRRGRLILLLAGAICCVSGLLVLLRVAPWLQATGAVAQFAAFIPFGLLGWLAVLGLTVPMVRRHRFARWMATLAVVLAAVQIAWLAPRFIAQEQPTGGRRLNLISQNLQLGAGATDEFLARARTADVVILVEVTPQAVKTLDARGIRSELPYGAGDPAAGAGGTYVYSRWPIRHLGLRPDTRFYQAFTQVEMPGVGPVAVVGVHPVNPLAGAAAWLKDARGIAATTSRMNPDVPIIMAGDFNAIPDHRTLRTIEKVGRMRPAAEEAGAGYLPSWPVHLRGVPPMLPIDHVLVRGDVRVDSISLYELADSDHRGIQAALRLPARGGQG